MMEWITGVAAVAVGGALGFVTRTMMSRIQSQSSDRQAAAKLAEAERESKGLRKEAEIQARAEVIKAREEFEQSTKERRRELSAVDAQLAKREAAIAQREENLDRKATLMDKKEQTIDRKLAELQIRQETVEKREVDAARMALDAETRLQKMAGMTHEEARRDLFERTERDIRNELGGLIRRVQEDARESASRDARVIVATAMHRYAGSHACESMTSTVTLASDDVKGRIIGREGRNIRALEAATGVTMLVDDTPEAVVISGFDPIRREIARQALEILIADGRIHPARIEEVVAKIESNMEQLLFEAGEEAAFKANIQGLDPELVKKLGRLKFRTSYSQNVLLHSLEVASLMSVMASELGLDPAIARRVGLFHDIGKAMDHQMEGAHATIGADFLRKCGEAEEVIVGVATHHTIADASIYGVLCATADAISSSRPGARTESSEIYIHRLEKLESIANEFPGVRKTYAVQAGREVRVIVDPEGVGDNEAMIMARDISKRVEAELQYPGQIRIVVIREKRCVDYAR